MQAYSEQREDDARQLLLRRFVEQVSHDRDERVPVATQHAAGACGRFSVGETGSDSLAHVLGNAWVEAHHPETEDELVLHLEADLAGQHADDAASEKVNICRDYRKLEILI